MATADILHRPNLAESTNSARNNESRAVIDFQQQNILFSTNLPKQEISQLSQFSSESDDIQSARIRNFSHWTYAFPSSESMISAGWFSCNLQDRVICIHCNTICQGWTIDDDPTEVHKRLAPQCPFVCSLLSKDETPQIINDSMTEACKPTYLKMAVISARLATYRHESWKQTLPSVEDLARAGFFYTGVENKVVCFCCNGCLHKWGPNDNPMIEHARWFPKCTYARQLCGEQLYRKIQASKVSPTRNSNIDQSKLNLLVASRLQLPVVRGLSAQYKLTVIKRCIEDQLRVKNQDFACDFDLLMACVILQKQIDHINGCRDKIIIPSKHHQQNTEQREKLQGAITSSTSLSSECLVCLREQRQIACIPCGHLCTCVPCGYSLESCPVCRQKINSFVRINF